MFNSERFCLKKCVKVLKEVLFKAVNQNIQMGQYCRIVTQF